MEKKALFVLGYISTISQIQLQKFYKHKVCSIYQITQQIFSHKIYFVAFNINGVSVYVFYGYEDSLTR